MAFRANVVLLTALVCLFFGTTASANDRGHMRDGRNRCTYDSWLSCVNNTKECHCYDKPAEPRNTVEKQIVMFYNDLLVEREYELASLIFDENIVVSAPAYQIRFEGKAINIAYLYLGDPTVSDSYAILNSTIVAMTQENLTVQAAVLIRYQNVLTQVKFEAYSNWLITFNELHLIQSMVIFPDSLTLAVNLQDTVNLNITILCQDIQRDCVGANQQYPDVQTCATFMSSIPLVVLGQTTTGNTVFCRSWHEVLARSAPDIHCIHTGSVYVSPSVTPCF